MFALCVMLCVSQFAVEVTIIVNSRQLPIGIGLVPVHEKTEAVMSFEQNIVEYPRITPLIVSEWAFLGNGCQGCANKLSYIFGARCQPPKTNCTQDNLCILFY